MHARAITYTHKQLYERFLSNHALQLVSLDLQDAEMWQRPHYRDKSEARAREILFSLADSDAEDEEDPVPIHCRFEYPNLLTLGASGHLLVTQQELAALVASAPKLRTLEGVGYFHVDTHPDLSWYTAVRTLKVADDKNTYIHPPWLRLLPNLTAIDASLQPATLRFVLDAGHGPKLKSLTIWAAPDDYTMGTLLDGCTNLRTLRYRYRSAMKPSPPRSIPSLPALELLELDNEFLDPAVWLDCLDVFVRACPRLSDLDFWTERVLPDRAYHRVRALLAVLQHRENPRVRFLVDDPLREQARHTHNTLA